MLPEQVQDVVVDLPDSDDLLVLTFTTQSDGLRVPLMELFEAMAGTLVVERTT